MKPYYKHRFFTLYPGDCRDLLPGMEEDSVDMIFADPPYNLSNNGFTCHAGKRVSVNKGKWDVSRGIEEDFQFHLDWIRACRRVLKPSGTIWISGTYHSIYACGYALQISGYKLLNDITWFKPNASPNLSCRYFTASHETLLWAIKDEKAKHTFNYNEMRSGPWEEDALKKPGKQMRSVWSINTLRQSEKKHGKHPTQKPEALLRRIIMASTREKDMIIDPFTGSSTTGLMAYQLGRRYVGIDTEKAYLELSVRRFNDIK
jgi:site-specific DNA-methyltransferase (adenine-specific)